VGAGGRRRVRVHGGRRAQRRVSRAACGSARAR
jgi:hypothetical protein